MQWGKVKNILLVILLAVDLFLAGNLVLRYFSARYRTEELAGHLNTLLAADHAALTDSFSLPQDKILPILYLDRSRAEEQVMAQNLIGEEAVHEEDETGTAVYRGTGGMLSFASDGTIRGTLYPTMMPQGDAACREQVVKWLESQSDDNPEVTAQNGIVTVRSAVAGQAVHNRSLTFSFTGAEGVTVEGRWSFETPYTTAGAANVTCSAADALLSFAGEETGMHEIRSMQLGYRLEEDDGRRLQLAPTWKIDTDQGQFLVDCAKKTTV